MSRKDTIHCTTGAKSSSVETQPPGISTSGPVRKTLHSAAPYLPHSSHCRLRSDPSPHLERAETSCEVIHSQTLFIHPLPLLLALRYRLPIVPCQSSSLWLSVSLPEVQQADSCRCTRENYLTLASHTWPRLLPSRSASQFFCSSHPSLAARAPVFLFAASDMGGGPR